MCVRILYAIMQVWLIWCVCVWMCVAILYTADGQEHNCRQSHWNSALSSLPTTRPAACSALVCNLSWRSEWDRLLQFNVRAYIHHDFRLLQGAHHRSPSVFVHRNYGQIPPRALPRGIHQHVTLFRRLEHLEQRLLNFSFWSEAHYILLIPWPMLILTHWIRVICTMTGWQGHMST